MKTPPNATPFLILRPEQGSISAPCGCLMEPYDDDGDPDAAAFFQCGTHETLPAAIELIGSLAAALKESHDDADELKPKTVYRDGGRTTDEEPNHHGDGAAGCSYCELIIAADTMQRQAIGLEPRQLKPCAACDTDQPVDDDGACLICGGEL